MDITIDTIIVAKADIQTMSLRPVVGAYDLHFSLNLSVLEEAGEPPCPGSVTIDGARIVLKIPGGRSYACGFARPESPISFTQTKDPQGMTPGLSLPLQPGQIAAIEDLRGTADLDFELALTGTGEREHGRQAINETLRIHVPRSQWIKQLRDAGARDVLLFEVPLPFGTVDDSLHAALLKAEEQFRGGDYNACVGSCRIAVQELGMRRFANEDWATPALKRLGEAQSRDAMDQEVRLRALWAALRHYTHQAHHGSGEGGVDAYSRADAELILTMTASCVGYANAR